MMIEFKFDLTVYNQAMTPPHLNSKTFELFQIMVQLHTHELLSP